MSSIDDDFERLDASSHEHLEAQLLRSDEAATKDVRVPLMTGPNWPSTVSTSAKGSTG
ncbi:MAG: hypothetical protein ACLP1E_06060 [Acidimicrobiales bacterium]